MLCQQSFLSVYINFSVTWPQYWDYIFGCRNKTPQTGWFKQQSFIFSWFQRPGSPRSECQHDWFLVGVPSFSLCLHMTDSQRDGAGVGIEKDRDREKGSSVSFPLPVRAPLPPGYDLISSFYLCYLFPGSITSYIHLGRKNLSTLIWNEYTSAFYLWSSNLSLPFQLIAFVSLHLPLTFNLIYNQNNSIWTLRIVIPIMSFLYSYPFVCL